MDPRVSHEDEKAPQPQLEPQATTQEQTQATVASVHPVATPPQALVGAVVRGAAANVPTPNLSALRQREAIP